MCTSSLPASITPRGFNITAHYPVLTLSMVNTLPRRFYQSPVLSLGPMQMVVMDYVSHLGVTPPDPIQQIRAVLYKLHRRGYVIGDLRAQNILFDEDSKVKFIDFDWSGRYDMNVRNESLSADLQKRIDDEKRNVESVDRYVCYPSSNIHWAPDARDLEPIRPEHDWFMLNNFPSKCFLFPSLCISLDVNQ